MRTDLVKALITVRKCYIWPCIIEHEDRFRKGFSFGIKWTITFDGWLIFCHFISDHSEGIKPVFKLPLTLRWEGFIKNMNPTYVIEISFYQARDFLRAYRVVSLHFMTTVSSLDKPVRLTELKLSAKLDSWPQSHYTATNFVTCLGHQS